MRRSLGDTIIEARALAAKLGKPVYIFATMTGYVIERKKPVFQAFYEVSEDAVISHVFNPKTKKGKS